MIDIVLGFLDGTEGGDAAEGDAPTGHGADRARLLSPEAWQALRYAMARLAIRLVSGPDRLAAALRQGLLDAPYNARSVPLDIGYSASIPGYIRRAVQLRARHCEWPGCDKPPAWCDVHHLRHKADGGETSVQNCVLLVSSTMMSASTGGAGGSSCTPTAPPPPTGPGGRSCIATARPAMGHHAAADRPATARRKITPRKTMRHPAARWPDQQLKAAQADREPPATGRPVPAAGASMPLMMMRGP